MMSLDEDVDIDRLRSDLIKSIRSKKSSRRNADSSTTSSPSKSSNAGNYSTGGKNTASSILDTDMDDLEALRRAALFSVKKRESASAQAPSMENQPPGIGSFNVMATTAFPNVPVTMPYIQQQYYPPPPILIGPGASYSQFPAPPPAYQPRFFNHLPNHMNAFRPLVFVPAPRSNLIVIQTAPPPGEQQSRSTQSTASSFGSGKLLLPQDRYMRRDQDGGPEKKKHDKWSRYDDSHSESSDEESTIEHSAAGSDDESDVEASSKKSSISSAGTPLEEESRGAISDDAEISSDTDYTAVIVDECHSSDDAAEVNDSEDPNPGTEYERDISSAEPATIIPASEQHESRPVEEDIFLEEPIDTIEFLDEPVDDDVVQQFMDDSTQASESVSTSEPPLHQTIADGQETDSPPLATSKEKEEIESKLRAIEQQLEKLHRSNKRSNSRSRKDRRSRSRSGHGHSSRGSGGTKREGGGRRHHRHSPQKKQLLSSVVVRSKEKANDVKPVDDAREIMGEEHSSNKPRRNIPSSSGKLPLAKSDTRHIQDGRTANLPSVGEDLRKFLEKKKDKGGSIATADTNANSLDGIVSIRTTSKVISLKKVISDEKTASGHSGQDSMTSRMVKRRISPPRMDAIKVDYDVDYYAVGKKFRPSVAVDLPRASVCWRNSGAAKEGSNNGNTGKKVTLKKRPY